MKKMKKKQTSPPGFHCCPQPPPSQPVCVAARFPARSCGSPSVSPASSCHPQPSPVEFLGPPQPAGAAEADTRGPRVISHLAAESDPDSARAAAVFASGPPPEPGPRCQGPLHPLFNRRRAPLGPSPKTLPRARLDPWPSDLDPADQIHPHSLSRAFLFKKP
jgi:hypothetical protein